ncbi:hypothetical protein CPB85DRAFT_1301223 [Mucidula mucida]|nr:hypothetical protein CPB85DRAFT_1301223 [Mucidula mucida]
MFRLCPRTNCDTSAAPPSLALYNTDCYAFERNLALTAMLGSLLTSLMSLRYVLVGEHSSGKLQTKITDLEYARHHDTYSFNVEVGTRHASLHSGPIDGTAQTYLCLTGVYSRNSYNCDQLPSQRRVCALAVLLVAIPPTSVINHCDNFAFTIRWHETICTKTLRS